MTKHTEGPWEIVEADGDEYWLPLSHFNVGPAIGIDTIEDARLIAAAPEMLEALKEVRGYLQCAVDGSMSRNNAESLAAELIEKIDAAIAKEQA